MATPEALRRARAAHRERQKAEGWRQKAFFLAPDTVARLARLAAEMKVSEAATIGHALAKLEEERALAASGAAAISERVVIGEEAVAKPAPKAPKPKGQRAKEPVVRPADEPDAKPKIDTSAVQVHPSLRKTK